MTSRSRLVAVAAAALVAGTLSGCDQRPRWHNELVSIDATGTARGESASFNPVFSPDGTKIAFESRGGNLVAGTSFPGIYMRDLTTDTTSLVSVNDSGAAGVGGTSANPVFSPDGTKIAFHSGSTNLVPNDTNRHVDIFVRDLAAGTTSLVSVNATGTDGGDNNSYNPTFGPDGTTVAFGSFANDLVPAYDGLSTGVFLRDLVTNSTRFVGYLNGGVRDPVASFSPDGTEIAFETHMAMTAIDKPETHDVYIRDLVTDELTLVSVNATGDDTGSSGSYNAVFSPDGTQVAFESLADDLGPVDSTTCPEVRNGPFVEAWCRDVYVRDLVTGTTTLVSANSTGDDSGNALSWNPQFSPDGKQILFESAADDLGAVDSPRNSDVEGNGDIYVRDLETATTSLVSANAAATDSGNRRSLDPQFSPDGRRIAFESYADNLGPVVSVPRRHVYVRDLATGVTSLVSMNAAGTDGADREATDPVWGPSSRVLAFVSEADLLVDLPPGVLVRSQVYVATLPEADVSVALDAAPSPVTSGADITYTVDIDNAGPDPATDVEAGLLLPEGTTFVDATTPTGTCTPPQPAQPRAVACQLGDIDPNDNTTITITANVTAPPTTTLTALALTTTPTLDPNTTNNTTTHTTPIN